MDRFLLSETNLCLKEVFDLYVDHKWYLLCCTLLNGISGFKLQSAVMELLNL